MRSVRAAAETLLGAVTDGGGTGVTRERADGTDERASRPVPRTLDLLVVGPAGVDTGGIARYMNEQCEQLADDVRVRAFDTATPQGGRYEYTGVGGFLEKVGRSLLDMVRFPFRSPPDLLHVHTMGELAFYRSMVYVLFGSVVWNRPVVLHMHAADLEWFFDAASPLGRRLQALTFRHSAAVIVLSEHWERVFADCDHVPDDDLVVIPNGVDQRAYRPAESDDTGADADADHPDADDPPRVVSLAHLIERKGFEEMAVAADRLADRGVPFTLDIAGRGPLEPLATELEERYPTVEYHGYVSEERKRELLARADLYVLPSHAEGLPISILEAMGSGAAVVSTTVGSIPEFIDDDAGWTVPPADADALTETLEEALADAGRLARCGANNRRAVETTYNWDDVTDQLLSLYGSVLDARQGAGESERR